MTSWSGRAVVGILAISLTAACCESASAQGRGGRGGRGGFGMFGRNIHQIDLATLPEVQEELALTDEQKTKVADLNDEFRGSAALWAAGEAEAAEVAAASALRPWPNAPR
jgi:hypothetical protein